MSQEAAVQVVKPTSREAMLVVRPEVCLYDVPTTILVSGLPPHSPVTITAVSHDDEGTKVWCLPLVFVLLYMVVKISLGTVQSQALFSFDDIQCSLDNTS